MTPHIGEYINYDTGTMTPHISEYINYDTGTMTPYISEYINYDIVYFIFPVLVSFLAIIYKLLHALTSYLVCIVYIWSGNMCECLSKIGQLLLVLPHLPLC